jgi:hypothetical protein
MNLRCCYIIRICFSFITNCSSVYRFITKLTKIDEDTGCNSLSRQEGVEFWAALVLNGAVASSTGSLLPRPRVCVCVCKSRAPSKGQQQQQVDLCTCALCSHIGRVHTGAAQSLLRI